MPDLRGVIRRITAVDLEAERTARERLDRLAKPPGSLGRLEDLAARLSAIAGTCPPPVPASPSLIVAVGDHGVHAQGVTRWPQELSAAIADLVVEGRATAGVLARQVGASVIVIDVGLAGARPRGVINERIRAGTRDLTLEPAMTDEEAGEAISVGVDVVDGHVEAGADVIVLGEVGIANTTPSAALLAALTGRVPAEVTGPGAANDAETVRRKVAVVERALARHGDGREPLDVLASLGGFEHAALVGMVLSGAANRVPVVLDGVTTVAAALVAARLAPDVTGYLVASHRSGEPGAGFGLVALGLLPLLVLELRLGEGSGGLLAVPLVQSAARVLSEVASLDEL